MFLKNRNISSKIKRSKVTDYAALTKLALPQRVFFSIIALTIIALIIILTKAYCSYCHKGCFLYFRPYSNENSPTKSVLLHFCPYSNLSPATKMFFSISTTILTEALPKRVIFSVFALILTKALVCQVLH